MPMLVLINGYNSGRNRCRTEGYRDHSVASALRENTRITVDQTHGTQKAIKDVVEISDPDCERATGHNRRPHPALRYS